MPSWSELASSLALQLPDDGGVPLDPIDVLSDFEAEHHRYYLVRAIRDALHVGSSRPGEVHRSFVQVPFDEILTTNFDTLIEEACRECQLELHVAVDDVQLATARSRSVRRLLKLHGCIERPDTLIVTEADFDRYLTRQPLFSTEFSSLFIRRTALMIGYSLSDPNLRQLLSILRERLGDDGRPMFALGIFPSDADVRRFRRRGVHVVDLCRPGEDPERCLLDLFREMAEAMRSAAVSSLASTGSAMAEDIDAAAPMSNVVYFAAAPASMAYCRENLYPVVQKSGLIPISADEAAVVSSDISTREALIQRALCVVAVGRESPRVEAAFARRSKVPVLVLDHPRELDARSASAHWTALAEKVDSFITTNRTIQRRRTQLIGEPQRLLDKNEHRAAIIAGVSVLEAHLRDRLASESQAGSTAPLRQLMPVAVQKGLVEPADVVELEWSLYLRNVVAHSQEEVAREDAERVVALIGRILRST